MKPSVFISYSYDSTEHCEWVERLSAVLTRNDVSVTLDAFIVFPGSNLEEFMEKGLEESAFILCICSDGYLEKINCLNSGVSKEISIIKKLKKINHVIPVMRNNSTRQLPDFLDGCFYCDLSKLDVFHDKTSSEIRPFVNLLRVLHGKQQHLSEQNVSSKNPFDVSIAEDRIIETHIKQSTYINPAMAGTVRFKYNNNNGRFHIGSGKYSFETSWSHASNISIHAYKDYVAQIALIEQIGDINNIQTTEDLDFTSRARTANVGNAIVWLNKNGHMAITKIIGITARNHTYPSPELYFEYLIWDKPR